MQQVQKHSWSIPGGEDADKSITLLQSARVNPSSVCVLQQVLAQWQVSVKQNISKVLQTTFERQQLPKVSQWDSCVPRPCAGAMHRGFGFAWVFALPCRTI